MYKNRKGRGEGDNGMLYTKKHTERGKRIQTNISGIQTTVKHKKSVIHHEILFMFARILSSLNIDFNIDHIKPACKVNERIPLRDYKGKKYDIAFVYKNTLVFVEIRTVSKWQYSSLIE